MCTSISLSTPVALSGRNMDIEYSFGEQVVITPRNYRFFFQNGHRMQSHFAMIGMAHVADGFPLYAEAANEKGLYIAGLNFPDNAFYFPPSNISKGKKQLAPYELIPFLLGTCQTTEEAKKQLEMIQLTALPFSSNMPLAPLHWHIADSKSAIVAEPRKEGLCIYKDSVGVLTNNPPYPFHLMNLHNYQSLTPHPPENHFHPALPLQVYGEGMGALGLPGDASPMSRFIKAAFLVANSVAENKSLEPVSQFFHILDSVAMVRGSVVTANGRHDITTYSSCINLQKGIYYYKTYYNHQITAVHLFHENLDANELKVFPLATAQQVFYMN